MAKDIALVRLFIWLPRFENFEVSYVCLIRKRIIMANTVVVYKIIFSDIALARSFIWLPRFEGIVLFNGFEWKLKPNKVKILLYQVFNTSGPT